MLLQKNNVTAHPACDLAERNYGWGGFKHLASFYVLPVKIPEGQQLLKNKGSTAVEPNQSVPLLDETEKREARIDEMRQKLAKSGHRITPQRLCILEALTQSNAHPSAEEIFADVHRTCPTTSLATIYKTLQTLKKMDEVIELEFSDGSNRYDGLRPQSHAHVVCKRCGKIEDVEIEGLQDLEARSSAQSGFRIETYRIDLYGLCKDCQEI